MSAMRGRPAQAARRLAYVAAWRAANLRHLFFAAYLRAFVRSPAATSPLATASAQRILIMRLDEIGDFILTTPFLRAVRKHYRRAHITLLVNSSVQSIARPCPFVDEVMVFPVKRRPPIFDQLGTYLAARRFAKRQLTDRAFDCALIPRSDIDNAGALAMAYHAGIPCRVGHSERAYPLKAVKNRGYDRFLTHVIERADGPHEVLRTLALANAMSVPVDDTHLELWPSAEDEASAESVLAKFHDRGRVLVALAPGAGLDRRQWPATSFAELSIRLVESSDAQIVIVGGPADDALGKRIVAGAGKAASQILNVAGRTSLGATAAILGRCALFVGNDSGPLHMAAAMRAPCVELSCHPVDGDPQAANSPLRFSPWGVPSRVLQPSSAVAPCRAECTRAEAHCITAVPVDAAFAAAQELLASTRPAAATRGADSALIEPSPEPRRRA